MLLSVVLPWNFLEETYVTLYNTATLIASIDNFVVL